MADKTFYVTTPIYYVNDVPHVGHAYTTLAADVLSRYHKLLLGEENVFFLTGTDEHGANVAQAAEKHHQEPKAYADAVSPRFGEAWELLNIKPDFFIRTTDPRHEKIAQEVLQKIYDKGYIYEGTYEGWYCVGCEKFLTESEMVDGKCPLHPTREPVHQKEKNYFLKLKELSAEVLKHIEQGTYKILPEKRHNEIVSRIKQGVDDISISRAGVAWGIPVPWDKEQTIYVWVEALLNYFTATQFVEGKQKFWPPDVQLMAKDILWFHSVIWEALLIAADLELPKTIFAHGFFTIDGQKMSKSLGNVISPKQLVDAFGVDGSRYLLLTAYQFGNDGDLSLSKFKDKYNADLANGLGNLVARVAKLAESSDYINEIKPLTYPETLSKTESDQWLSGEFNPLDQTFLMNFPNQMERFEFIEVLMLIWGEISRLDKQIEQDEPWKLVKTNKEQLHALLSGYIKIILSIATLLLPFLPETAEKILKQFQGPTIKAQEPLFPRLT